MIVYELAEVLDLTACPKSPFGPGLHKCYAFLQKKTPIVKQILR